MSSDRIRNPHVLKRIQVKVEGRSLSVGARSSLLSELKQVIARRLILEIDFTTVAEGIRCDYISCSSETETLQYTVNRFVKMFWYTCKIAGSYGIEQALIMQTARCSRLPLTCLIFTPDGYRLIGDQAVLSYFTDALCQAVDIGMIPTDFVQNKILRGLESLTPRVDAGVIHDIRAMVEPRPPKANPVTQTPNASETKTMQSPVPIQPQAPQTAPQTALSKIQDEIRLVELEQALALARLEMEMNVCKKKKEYEEEMMKKKIEKDQEKERQVAVVRHAQHPVVANNRDVFLSQLLLTLCIIIVAMLLGYSTASKKSDVELLLPIISSAADRMQAATQHGLQVLRSEQQELKRSYQDSVNNYMLQQSRVERDNSVALMSTDVSTVVASRNSGSWSSKIFEFIDPILVFLRFVVIVTTGGICVAGLLSYCLYRVYSTYSSKQGRYDYQY